MARRRSLCLSWERILPGYLLALVAATAAVDYLPFSMFRLSLLAVMLGIFYVIAIPVLVMAFLRAGLAVARALMGLGRRLLLGTDQNSGSQGVGKPQPLRKDLKSLRTNAAPWDQWIDGFWGDNRDADAQR
jgi:hypothetical protein